MSGTSKRIKIKAGEVLFYRAKGSAHVSHGKIASFKEDKIMFENGYITLEELDEVIIRKARRQGSAITLMFAGAGYFLLDQFNNSVIDGNPLSLNSKVNRTAGIIVGSGLLLYFLSQRRIRIGKKRWISRIQYFD